MEVFVELHESVIECEDRELVLLIADTESRTCHGILTLNKIDDERKYRKRRSQSYEKVVVSERKKKRFQCAHCDPNVLILFLAILYHLQYGKGEQRFVKTGKRRLRLCRVCSDYSWNILKFIRHRPPAISTDRRHRPQSASSSTDLHRPP